MKKSSKNKRLFLSLGIIALSLGLSYLPIPGVKQTITIVAGTELQEPLQELATRFERDRFNLDLELKFQGSQDIVNNYLAQNNDLQSVILIPANGNILQEYNQAFYSQPQAIAKTILVGIAWQERGKTLFPDDKFSWSKIEQALQQNNWSKIANKTDWGSFDFVMTNPTRSNSGQLTLDLWLESTDRNFNSFETQSLISLIKNSIYQPPRSTDILLQEFISRGANDGDVAVVYESIALHRWSQAQITQRKPYRIYYPNPTIETVATAAIVKQNISKNTAKTASKFIQYLTQPEQQQVFVQYGFRPVVSDLDLTSVPNSPWSQNITGAMLNLDVTVKETPASGRTKEIQKIWNQVP